tara:strand:- start:831 stop:1568 length:738 start_codon:yes stop_codon:yes gene_type:complete
VNRDHSIFAETSTWPKIQQAINRNLTCIIPVGASCKEHGPHLPLNTDYIQSAWLCEQLARRFPLIVWPTISFGYYPAFVDYPGSWSISEETFIQCVHDIIESIARHGNNRIILINTGISTIKPIEQSLLQSAHCQRIKLINVYSGEHTQKTIEKIEEQRQGGHADEIETSIMLAIDESLVDMSLAREGLQNINDGPLNLHDPDKPNYCPTGSMGNPMLASQEKGTKILEAMLDDLIEIIEPITQQ